MVGDGAASVVSDLRQASGKDIWLSGGGDLFRSLLQADLVDTIEVGISPMLLGQGRPFLPPTCSTKSLRLTHSLAYPSGLLILHYDVKQ
jgi:dihydrofolate reductase